MAIANVNNYAITILWKIFFPFLTIAGFAAISSAVSEKSRLFIFSSFTLTPPCSKSYAQRALAAALLSEEVSVLRNIEFCDDTRSALQCIETLGARVRRVDPTSLSVSYTHLTLPTNSRV